MPLPMKSKPRYNTAITANEPPTPIWKSGAWQVLVAGSLAGLALWGRDSELNTQRPIYNSLEACLKDWNNQMSDCEQKDEYTPSNASGSGSYTRLYGVSQERTRLWYGPDIDQNGVAYHGDGRVTTGHTRLSTSSFRNSTITRGGFGGGHSRGG